MQEDTEGMAGVISTGTMVADAIFYNWVGSAPYWYTPSETTTIVQVRHVLQTGLELQKISRTNKLPSTCNTAMTTRQKAVMIARLDHDIIMEEVKKHNVLEYDSADDEEESIDEEDESRSEVESDSEVE